MFECHSIQFIDNVRAKNSNDAIKILWKVVKLLHRIPDQHGMKIKNPKMDKFFDKVDREEFSDVTMWLTEKLSELTRKENISSSPNKK